MHPLNFKDKLKEHKTHLTVKQTIKMFYIRNCSGKVTNRRKRKKVIGMETKNKNPKKKVEAAASTIKKTNQEKLVTETTGHRNKGYTRC